MQWCNMYIKWLIKLNSLFVYALMNQLFGTICSICIRVFLYFICFMYMYLVYIESFQYEETNISKAFQMVCNKSTHSGYHAIMSIKEKIECVTRNIRRRKRRKLCALNDLSLYVSRIHIDLVTVMHT